MARRMHWHHQNSSSTSATNKTKPSRRASVADLNRAVSVPGLEFEGQRDRASDTGHLLPVGAFTAARIGHAARDDAERFDEFESGEVRAQAVVRAAAERHVGRRRLAGDI